MSTWVVFRREVAHYAGSPFAYLIAFAILVLTGLLFREELVATETTIPNPAVIPNALSFFMVVFAPLLTMRLVAEEKREGTLELLLTAPVPDGSIVIGKFLGAWFYFSVVAGITLLYQIGLSSVTSPDLGHTLASYIGIWLYGGATLSVGILFSALTENQIVAAFLAMITLFLLWLADSAGQVVSNIDVASTIRLLSLQGHFSTSFSVGLVRMEDMVFFLGIILLMVYLATRAVESNRWR